MDETEQVKKAVMELKMFGTIDLEHEVQLDNETVESKEDLSPQVLTVTNTQLTYNSLYYPNTHI